MSANDHGSQDDQPSSAGRGPTSSARTCTACGPRSPGRGPSTRTTSTRAARRSTSRMLELSRPSPGERVLELACGPGGVGLAAAERVAPDGEVVLSDVVAEMTAIAAARADGARARQREHPRARPRADRRARRLLRRRALPRGAHARARPRPRGARDPAGPAARRPGRARRLGPARAQPLARRRLRRGRARSSARRCRRPASPVPSRSTIRPARPGCSPAAGLRGRRRQRAADAAARRLVRGVVDADVGARRAAREDARVAARARRARHSAPASVEAVRAYETPAGLEFPGRHAPRRGAPPGRSIPPTGRRRPMLAPAYTRSVTSSAVPRPGETPGAGKTPFDCISTATHVPEPLTAVSALALESPAVVLDHARADAPHASRS